MSEETRLTFHWSLFLSVKRGFRPYQSKDYDSVLYKEYILDSENIKGDYNAYLENTWNSRRA